MNCDTIIHEMALVFYVELSSYFVLAKDESERIENLE